MGRDRIFFTNLKRRSVVKEAAWHLKSFFFTLFLVSDLRVGVAITQLDDLNVMGIIVL